MAVITFPTAPGLKSIEVTLVPPPSQLVRSEWTHARKVISSGAGGYWRFKCEVAETMTLSEYRDWRRFFAELRGRVNTFYLPLLFARHALAEPVVNVALAKGATSMNLDGMTVSSAYIGKGEYMTVSLSGSKQLLMSITSLTSNGSGVATGFTFTPPLHGAVADNAVTETSDPYAECALIEDEVTWVKGPGGVYSFGSFECEEVW